MKAAGNPILFLSRRPRWLRCGYESAGLRNCLAVAAVTSLALVALPRVRLAARWRERSPAARGQTGLHCWFVQPGLVDCFRRRLKYRCSLDLLVSWRARLLRFSRVAGRF